jgi:hypothetical protein
MKTKQATIRALILTRVSTDRQTEGVSVAKQEAACRSFCQQRGWEPVALTGAPAAISGQLPWEERIDLHAALDLYENRRVDKIVVYAQDRLERDAVVLITFIRAVLDARKVRGKPQGGYDVITHTGTVLKLDLATKVTSVANTEWASNILKTTSSAKHRRIAEDKQPVMGGVLPLGYARLYSFDAIKGRRTVDKIILHEDEAALVRRIFGMYEDGEGLNRIANLLMAEGVPSPWVAKGRKDNLKKKKSGKPCSRRWHAATVRDILMREVYTGRYTLYADPPSGKLRELEVTRDAAVLEVPAIIKPDQFDRVKVRLTSQRNRTIALGAATKGRDVWDLQGFVYCGCGGLMQKRPTRIYETSKGERGSRMMQCMSRRLRLRSCKNMAHYRLHHDNVLVPAVVQALQQAAQDPSRTVGRYLAAIDGEIAALRLELRPAQGDRAQIEQARQRLVGLVRKGHLTDAELAAEVSTLDAQVAKLKKQSKGKVEELAKLESLEQERDRIAAHAADVAAFQLTVGKKDWDHDDKSAAFQLLMTRDGKVVDARSLRELANDLQLRIVVTAAGLVKVHGDFGEVNVPLYRRTSQIPATVTAAPKSSGHVTFSPRNMTPIGSAKTGADVVTNAVFAAPISPTE